MEYTSSKESHQILGKDGNIFICGNEFNGSTSTEFSHEPNSVNYMREHVSYEMSFWPDTISKGPQEKYNAEEHVAPSNETTEFEATGSRVGSELYAFRDVTNYGQGYAPSVTYNWPENNMNRHPIREVAAENFVPYNETAEIKGTESYPRFEDSVSYVPSFATSSPPPQEHALTDNIYTQSKSWEHDIIDAQQERNNSVGYAFPEDKTNQFELVRNHVMPVKNVLNEATNYTQGSLPCTTYYRPETNLNRQQSCKAATENYSHFDASNEFDITGRSTRLKENDFNLPSLGNCFFSQDRTFTDYNYLEPNFLERDIRSEQQGSYDGKEYSFPADQTNHFYFIGRTAGPDENHFKLQPVNSFFGPQYYPLTEFSYSESKSQECTKSDKMCSSEDLLHANIVCEKRENRHECQTCMKKFPNITQLRIHERIHTGEKPYECGTCKKRFTLKHNLTQHELRHTGNRPYGCELWGKRFYSKSELESHQRVHLREKPYECGTCKRTFTQKRYLTLHGLRHRENRPYGCELCGKRFYTKSELESHQRVHTRAKPYECEICTTRFARKSDLIRHLLTHTGERPFECEICHQKFKQKRYLLVHEAVHMVESTSF